ncbi:nucleotidyl transferase AbiEii/AbiGii toxin family protein [Mycoplasmopsis citelli]|uniref:nucleotidyl transferase AbiEii/AbiGii toxin family protein n=1 Tax=Mycoplasmopsis citelli TaxID=171281 RepID=UPI002114ACD0|nr:nucleotidyl transferase AbiEii/AbiGii toxin family protein [Mycoplasmopsis citelli]UUD36650.1 nucleotidyl transferase AbiEii/AbiGii toxin family protein [Mycoplasmopsis citelli]
MDLSLSWKALNYTKEYVYQSRSNTKQEKFIKELNDNIVILLKNEIIPFLEQKLSPILKDKEFKFYIDEKDEFNILFDYPKEYPVDSSILGIIRLEIGKISEPIPAYQKTIRTYVSEFYSEELDDEISVKIVDPLRTFYEKATILHREANRTNGNYPTKRYSRHYYDIYKMLESNIGKRSFLELKLLFDVVEFKKKFYRRNYAKYDEIYQGKLKLIPPGKALEIFSNDYKEMRTMIYGKAVSFDKIISVLQKYENEINEQIKSFNNKN